MRCFGVSDVFSADAPRNDNKHAGIDRGEPFYCASRLTAALAMAAS
jgi:hypothetical protein